MFLILRNRTYHFRYRLPVKLVPILGRYEIRATLRTSSKRIAQPMASRLAQGCRCIFTRLEFESEAVLMKLDRNTLNQIIKKKINETINFYVGRHIQDDDCTLEIALGNIEAMIHDAKCALAQGSDVFYLADEVRQFAETMGIEVDDDQVKLLAHHMTHAHLKGLHRSREILENGEPWLPGDGGLVQQF